MNHPNTPRRKFSLSGAGGLVEHDFEEFDAIVAQLDADLNEVEQRARPSASSATLGSTKLSRTEVARRLGVSHG